MKKAFLLLCALLLVLGSALPLAGYRLARAVLGRNEHDLRRAYEMGRRGIFTRICEGQQISDDEWHKAQEEAGAEGDGDAGEETEEGHEAE